MDEALRFFKLYEVWIYLLLGLGAVIYIRKFAIAWRELQAATFGLERDSAQSRLNQAASVLVLLIMMAVAEFVVVSFAAPLVPGASPLATPTLDLLATSTVMLEATGGVGGAPSTPMPLPTIDLRGSGCVPDQVEITFPEPDQVLSGEVEIRGTADAPNFGFYKLEVARRDEPLWLTIQAGRKVVQDGVLVASWDTSPLPPGDYALQLVIVDALGQSLPACIIPVKVGTP